MPLRGLSAAAQEFKPGGGLADSLAALRLGGRAAGGGGGGLAPPPPAAHGGAAAAQQHQQQHQQHPGGEEWEEADLHWGHGDEELERRPSTASSGDVSSPHASVVGPSPLPSPARASPAGGAGLLAVTEDPPSSFKAAEETAAMAATCEVTTYVETPASAELAAAEGGRRRLGPNDFELLRIVGQGAFGKVFQVRKRDTGEIFAMKVMRKDRVLARDHRDYVKAERDVLTAVVHPYVVTLRYSFQTPKKLYLVLDFINGGHLFFQLYRAGTFDEPLARLYAAEIVAAIAHLHARGFVHRDLKPENVLLDGEGHVRITDFGLAKGNISDAEHERTNSFIGTMEYMAPEIIAGRGHGKAVDWWSVGVLLYEMLCGVPPFRAKGRAQLQKLITAAKIKLPSYLSSEAQNLVKGLLQKDATKRLGYGPGGSADVQGHPFFRPINWRKLEARAIPSPFKPSIRSIDSVENFDKIWTDLPPHDSPCATPRDASLQDRMFEGFSYCSESFLAAAARTDADGGGGLAHPAPPPAAPPPEPMAPIKE